MIKIRKSISVEDLEGIIRLQKSNLKQVLFSEEIQKQGFVTVSHHLSDLEKMHQYEKNIVAINENQLVGYILAMTAQSKRDIPRLIEMYACFDRILYKDQPIASYNYIVVGQVCIDKNFRGKGLFRSCYDAYRDCFSARYDFAITEIASINLKSMSAHAHIGFKTIHTYTDSSDTEWNVVIWEW